MIPFLLIAAGGYLLGQSYKSKSYEKGGLADGGIAEEVKIKKIGDDIIFRIGRRATAVLEKTTLMDALDYVPKARAKTRLDLDYDKKKKFIEKNKLDLEQEVYYFDHVEVNPKYRGKGYASKLVKAVLNWSKQNKLKYLFLFRSAYDPWDNSLHSVEKSDSYLLSHLFSSLDDQQLKKFYERHGFKDIGGSTMVKKFDAGGQVHMTLQDVAEIKTDFPEADFWLQRKGSEKTIGKPKKAYYAEDIGIKIRPEYRGHISPEYIYYSLEYLHRKGVFENMAVGSLALKNLRVSDVKALPIAFGIRK